jgi:hypothetical protein
MHRVRRMMEFAKDIASNIGCACADAAKFVGGKSADAAKFVGYKTADAARFVGEGTVDIAKRVGPKRGIIGLVLIGGAVVGGVYLVRYLRSRAEESDEAMGADSIKSPKVRNAAKRAENAGRSMPH